jgi:hypothetical protein
MSSAENMVDLNESNSQPLTVFQSKVVAQKLSLAKLYHD